ncbi:MATE family efflux transporter [Corticimicrobacter populi]|uniref:Multidrug-efflux transporter n=1 Tax=Corticimicrobacter populi TaxID=2175229 RepID=A0A2V1JX85_9BURK|nr:MATE family efflux transporter [Corticimicrobacter populi]PWF22987.1 MATE family efflux transporter [Corticimicrobacter populi]
MNHPHDSAGIGAAMRRIVKQAWPVLISQWASMAYAVLDTAMTGHASSDALAIMGLSISVYVTVFVGLMGVLHALIPILAQHYGAGRLHEVGRAWGQGVWLALALSVLGIALMLFPNIWLAFSGDVEPAVRQGMASYLQALCLALPAALVFRTIYALGTSVSRPQVVMIINLIGLVCKAFFNWLLIYGKFGLPALGATGAGLSSALVAWITLALGFGYLRRNTWYLQFNLTLGRPRWRDQQELLRLGLPMGGSYLVEVCAFTFMALLVAREGVYAVGAQQIMSNLAALCFMMPMSIGVATASLAAQAIGAGRHDAARRISYAGLSAAIIGAVLTALLLTTQRETIVALYTDDAEVAVMALALLQIIPVFHLCDTLQCVNSYILRAYKIAVVPLLLQIVALSGFGLLGGWWLGFGPAQGALAPLTDLLMAGAPIGASAMWLMATLGLLLSATLLHVWFRRVAP